MIFQAFNSVKSKSLSLKYKRFTPSGYKDIEIKKIENVGKTQFLYECDLIILFKFFNPITICGGGVLVFLTPPPVRIKFEISGCNNVKN